ncbi:uncharacterized protein BKA78DRAFT_107308 [Phyllosticta capitalensis]|uniref:uncharacterized protein n=1 Tax=Phyllosticta capitalensis TaxID=121624 RepID=UPI0031304458
MVHFPCQRSFRASPKFQTHLGCLAALQLVGAFSSAARSKQPSHTDSTRPSQQTQPAGTTKTRSCNRRTRSTNLDLQIPQATLCPTSLSPASPYAAGRQGLRELTKLAYFLLLHPHHLYVRCRCYHTPMLHRWPYLLLQNLASSQIGLCRASTDLGI